MSDSERDKTIEWACAAMAPFMDQLPDANAELTVAVYMVKQAIFSKAMSRAPVGSSVFKDVWRHYCGQVLGLLTQYPDSGVMDRDIEAMKEILGEGCGCILCQLSRDIKTEIDELEERRTYTDAKPTTS